MPYVKQALVAPACNKIKTVVGSRHQNVPAPSTVRARRGRFHRRFGCSGPRREEAGAGGEKHTGPPETQEVTAAGGRALSASTGALVCFPVSSSSLSHLIKRGSVPAGIRALRLGLKRPRRPRVPRAAAGWRCCCCRCWRETQTLGAIKIKVERNARTHAPLGPTRTS